MQQHVRTLGWLYIIYGGILDVLAIVLFLILGGAGALSGDRQAFFVTSAVGIGVGAILLVISIPGIIAGIGLLKFQQWARVLALVLAVLHVLSFPLGTALAVYAFWVLLNAQTTPLFERPAVTIGT
ncbi:MAG TPA: hypothetical protein VL284_06250 [Thermoanaerobaculia bacterium]|nr:hypothetical protein [Thermoanaerobaculia bacterium]